MRWIVLALVLAAGCGDDDSTETLDAGPDAGVCRILVDDPVIGPGCLQCAYPEPGGTCLWTDNGVVSHPPCVDCLSD